MKKGAELDLGEVGYSCEVFLNGVSLGVKIFSPFVYELSGLEDENSLCIRVSNTLSNTLDGVSFEKLFRGYKPGFLQKIQSGFEKESLRSGLFGPVLIRW